MRRLGLDLAILTGSVALFAAAPVLACGIDGVPSLSGNGALVQRNTQRGADGKLDGWAPFVFTTHYRKGQSIKFSENTAELHASLLPQAFGHPWRWNFGDGHSTTGNTVHHTYRRAGQYKVVVSAYYSSYKSWYEFDSALIHVR